MTLTFKFDLVKMNERAEYIGQRSFTSTFVVWSHIQTHTHTFGGLLYLDH